MEIPNQKLIKKKTLGLGAALIKNSDLVTNDNLNSMIKNISSDNRNSISRNSQSSSSSLKNNNEYANY